MTMFENVLLLCIIAVMIPLRTGVVRDIRILVYSKVMSLPLGFFSEERKGDIMARMSGDVGEVEKLYNEFPRYAYQKSDINFDVFWYTGGYEAGN